MNEIKLSAKQLEQVKIAGIPDNRPNLYGEYPKMLYRPGTLDNHHHTTEPLKIAGKFNAETLVVDCAEAEELALADGWSVSPDPNVGEAAKARREADQAKDEEIARLRAQLAQQEKRGPGRPPNAPRNADAESQPATAG